MTSRLFHTVVAVGISLGAAACSAEAVDETVTTENAVSADAVQNPDQVVADAFCDATWPTTKGSFLRPPPACVDPNDECESRPAFECVTATEDNACSGFAGFYPVCKAGTWECKPGKIRQDQCRCWEWEGGSTCEAPPVDNRRPPQLSR